MVVGMLSCDGVNLEAEVEGKVVGGLQCLSRKTGALKSDIGRMAAEKPLVSEILAFACELWRSRIPHRNTAANLAPSLWTCLHVNAEILLLWRWTMSHVILGDLLFCQYLSHERISNEAAAPLHLLDFFVEILHRLESFSFHAAVSPFRPHHSDLL